MKDNIKIFLFVFILLSHQTYSQQVARATDVKLVTTAGTNLVLNGGITFLGTSNLLSTGDSIYLYTSAPVSSADWLDSTATGAMDVSSTGSVFFNGSLRQQFYGKTRFYNFFLRNPLGDTLLSSCEVRNTLNLDTGYLFTKSGYANDSLLVSNPTAGAIASTSSFAKSWVHGRLSRTISTATGVDYLFPIGKIKLPDSLYAPIWIDKASAVANTYTAEYFPSTPFDNYNYTPPIDHISKQEYWEITASTSSGPDADAKVSLSWRTYSRVSSIAAQRLNLLVVQYVANPGYAWWQLGTIAPHTVTGPDSSFGFVKHISYLGGFSYPERRYTLGTSTNTNPLPLQLLSFTATGDGNKVLLNWQVANEQDITVYEVEKSADALRFSHLITVNSQQRVQSDYTGYDYTPITGWNYYRLKVFDRTGNYTYSPVRAVQFSKGLEQVSLFPNPATGVLNIQMPSSYPGTVTLQVTGIDGKTISGLRPTSNFVQLDVKPLPAGTYVLRITSHDGTTRGYRFVKQ